MVKSADDHRTLGVSAGLAMILAPLVELAASIVEPTGTEGPVFLNALTAAGFGIVGVGVINEPR